MSADKGLAAAVNLSEATRAAKARPHTDINSSVRQCQASPSHIFVVPVRYALSEKPVKLSDFQFGVKAVSHPAFQPGVETKSHPMAARLLRSGFVYVWQGKGPLQRYTVAQNHLLRAQALDDDDTVVNFGTLSGIALDKHQEAWMLYSEIPLNPISCAQLSEPEIRAKRMRCLDLRQVANALQAPHCVPFKEAKSIMGELIPELYDLALAIDYQRNQSKLQTCADELGNKAIKDPTPDTINAYTNTQRWLSERAKVAAQYPHVPADIPAPGEWSAVSWEPTTTQSLMEIAHTQSRGLYTVLACLDDDLGVLRDINHEQELIESRHEQWQADNNLRLSIGGFVRSLITEDPDEVIGMLIYRYREQDIELTREQAQMLLNARTRLEQLARQRYTANIRRGTTHTNVEADTRLAEIHLREQAAVAPIRGFIPLQLHDEVLQVVRDYQESKVNNLRNKHTSDKVEQYIDLPAMNQWLDETAPRHFDHLKERHEALYTDRGAYLPRHHSGTWFVDYQDSDHRQWLDELALACLSAQCLRTVGAEQYADYVRSADDGALRQLFSGWSPSLDTAVVAASRAVELVAALSIENQANAEHALMKILGSQGLSILSNLRVLAQDATGLWNTLIKRLGASLLLLGSEPGTPFKGPWLTVMTAARVGSQVGLRVINENGRQVFKLFGKSAEELTQWVNRTGKAIGAGRVADIVNAPVVQKSGGVIALAALLLNSWNANNYLSQAAVLEGMDEQRQYDTASATLYAGAALMAVIDVQVRKGFWSKNGIGVDQVKLGKTSASTLTLFGAVIGFLAFNAALKEYSSLQLQLEKANDRIDPWLKLRQKVVAGQAAVAGAQGLLGLTMTVRSIAPLFGIVFANAGYLMWLGPVNYLLAILGMFYLVVWYMSQTPMQNFLNYCCWSKERARGLPPISLEAQEEELGRLYNILYSPRVRFEGGVRTRPTLDRQGFAYVAEVNSLTIDLPGAEPSSAYLELAIIGDQVDTLAWRAKIKKNTSVEKVVPPQSLQDIGEHWIRSSHCQWIPYQEGQGLRLSGLFDIVQNFLHSKPSRVSLRLRYKNPITAFLGAQSFIGGKEGLAFTFTPGEGLIALRDDPTSVLDKAQSHPLSAEKNSHFLQPKSNKK